MARISRTARIERSTNASPPTTRRYLPSAPAGTAAASCAHGIEVDLAARTGKVSGTLVHLTPIEWTPLATLNKHAGEVLTHRQLLHAVWGPEYGEEAHYLRVYMAQFRRKLEADPARPRLLVTEPGVGYRLLDE